MSPTLARPLLVAFGPVAAMIEPLKNFVKRRPYLVLAYRLLCRLFASGTPAYKFARHPIADLSDSRAISRTKVLNILEYTKTNQTAYSAAEFPAGYHTIEIDGERFEGQRNPAERLSLVPYEFTGKSFLDIGCNQGGMVYALGDGIKWGIGLDYDAKMIDACNLLRNRYRSGCFEFYVFDIDNDPHELITDFLPESRVDLVFLLSVCGWIERWKDLIDLCSSISDSVLFEANGFEFQQQDQIDHLRKRYSNVEILTDRSVDDRKQYRRRLVLAHNDD